jgi:hypothetical protein
MTPGAAPVGSGIAPVKVENRRNGAGGSSWRGSDKRNARTGKRGKRRAPCDNLQTFPMGFTMTDRAGAVHHGKARVVDSQIDL